MFLSSKLENMDVEHLVEGVSVEELFHVAFANDDVGVQDYDIFS